MRGGRTPLATEGRRSSLQFEEGIEKTVCWYLDNQVWMDRSAIRTLSQSFATERISPLENMRNTILRCIVERPFIKD